MYDPIIISQLCKYDDKLLGIPISMTFTVFYSNYLLLNQYNRKIPETWEEMIDTGKYILNEERKKDNNNLTGYIGLFNENERVVYSLYEFIYSFRNSIDTGFPEVGSQPFIDALEMMKTIKNELSSEEEFRSDDSYAVNKIFSGQSIFVKYWILGEPYINGVVYNITTTPGFKKGISSSIVSGYNLGIYKDIDKEKIDAAIVALMNIGSKEIQREFLLKRKLVSSIKSLYDEEEVCNKITECALFKGIQPLNNPFTNSERTDHYSIKFKNYIYEFLYGNKTAQEISQKIIDLTKIYQISINTSDSYIGLISIIVISTIAILMFFSLIALFKENFGPFFTFLSTDFWILSVIGTILILCIPFTNFGNITNTNCYLNSLFHSLGFTLILIPFLYELAIKFPIENIISKRIKKFKYLFLFFFILVDIIWNGLLLIEPFYIEEININDGKNFEVCKAKSTLSKIILIIKWSYLIIIILVTLLLIFTEWNIESTYYDLRFFMAVIYIDILGILLIICFNLIIINNYIIYFLIRECIYLIVAISNYILIYGFRLVFGFIKKKDIRIEFINKINKGFIDDKTELTIQPSTIQSSFVNDFNINSITDNNGTMKNDTNHHYDINITDSIDTGDSALSQNRSIYSKIMYIHFKTKSE
ncbi:hypothetical protein BCR36DRAFT_54015 [Piromyces finnis]|uniref:Periplasmic binding protein-like II n=1 Tax=Piromyces finnis TaxID=1754191 RepID=A0A1Y1VAN7_9FUNG|nr:hypothetical protein BCR36DRAFT_54015 [Piromyces finnis]|eukprot:ORX50628.1 hypothetical protein BCR36DRAFT_54015 [Piromyces finnis]